MKKLVVFSDSKYCIDGIRKIEQWKLDGWTRNGKQLKNKDLWKLMDKAIGAMKNARLPNEYKYVSAHVGIYGNEKADRLAAAAAATRREHRIMARSVEEVNEDNLDRLADDIVEACLLCM